MKLECFKIHDVAPEIVPGNSQRKWMDDFPGRQPYRCLPLTMANSTGWEILCPIDITIEWNGGSNLHDINFSTRSDPRAIKSYVSSHFTQGIVTFHTGHLFRTPPGWGVWATGVPNWPKDGIAPLTGLVETDWLPFPFTMNWQMTRPGKVTFEKDEPFCFITLFEHGKLEAIEPERRLLATEPELLKEYEAWTKSRSDFIERLNNKDPKAMNEGWQRYYMKGEKVSGGMADEHQSKRRLKKPKDI